MGGPDITDHPSDLELWNRMVLNRGQIRPGGQMNLKTTINIKPYLVVEYRQVR